MDRFIKSRIRTWALLALFGLLGIHGALGTANAQTSSPADVVSAFFNALGRGDKVAAYALIDPAGNYVENADTPFDHRHDLGTFVEEVGSGKYVFRITRNEQTGPDTAVTEVIIVSGPDIPPLPNPFTWIGTSTVRDGRITAMTAVFSDQTLRDLEAFLSQAEAQPGMPSTGSNNPVGLPLVVALGAALLASGLFLRKKLAS